MSIIGIISLVLSVLLIYEGDQIFAASYISTLLLSMLIGTYIIKKVKKD